MSLLDTISSPADVRRLSLDQLPALASEIRRAICDQVSRSGGHLAPNLGVVELTLALHYVFDFSHDRLLFDVGHQCYPHKLITGRRELLGALRTSRGMSGFPEPDESPYDLFRVGHAGTAISTGVGLARADSLSKQAFEPRTRPDGRRVVAVVGDASIVNGVAMEGLNNAGTLGRQFLVVLNDNGMGISRPQGAVSQYFDRLRLSHIYSDFKHSAKRMLRHVPGGSLVEEAYHRMGEATKAMYAEGAWFEHFGLVTVGPIDGHDIPLLVEFLAEASQFDRPMVLHVNTVKGKGFEFAEVDSTRFHSPGAFNVDPDSARAEIASDGRSFTRAFGEAMCDLMERDARVVACTAAMPDGTGLSAALERFPDRAWDTGICESHAMDMMAGLAHAGYRPFFAVYSTFLQRAFDQAFQEVSLQGLAVRLCLDRAGLVGGDGAVHHGFCDVALLRSLPGTCLMAAIDEPSLIAAMEFMRTFDDGLSAVRYPRDVVSDRLVGGATPPFELGRARCLTPALDVRAGAAKPDVAVLGYGTPTLAALEAADTLAGEVRVAVYDARFAKPIDEGLVRALLSAGVRVVTVEDHGLVGGFGTCVLECAQENGLDASRVARAGIPDHFIRQDPRSKQLAEAGLDAAGIRRTIEQCVARRGASGGMVEPVPRDRARI